MLKQIYILQNTFTNLKTRKIGKTGQNFLTGSDPEFLMPDLLWESLLPRKKKVISVFACGSTVKPQILPEKTFSTKTHYLFIVMICRFFEDCWEKQQENIDHRSKTKSCVHIVTGSQQFQVSLWGPRSSARIEERSWTISPASCDLIFDNFNKSTIAC